MFRTMFICIEGIKFQHRNTIKYCRPTSIQYSVCVDRDQSKLEQ